IIQHNCQECHRPGQIGPFALLTYDDVVAWSETIREVVTEERMPPWYADPHYGKFTNDRRLSAADKQALLSWISQGCPKGDAKDMPPPREWVAGWGIDKPDAVFTMPQAYDVPAAAPDPQAGIEYQYFTVDTGFQEDRWVVQAEARPGAPEVVHHILVFIESPGKPFQKDRPGNTGLCGVAPGDMEVRLPPGTANGSPPGSKVVSQ